MRHDSALILLYDQERRFLLQRRTVDAPIMPGCWGFFGGGLQAGETPEDAVRREAFEELNYVLSEPAYIGALDFTGMGVMGRLFAFVEALGCDKSALELREGQDWGWFGMLETEPLELVQRDRKILRAAVDFLDGSLAEAPACTMIS